MPHTLLVIDFYVLIAALIVAFAISLRMGAWRKAMRPTAAHVAAEIGATDVQTFAPTLYASDEADAVWHGRNVDIATFATTQLQDNWKQIAGPRAAILTEGPLYTVADNGPAN